MEALFDLEQGTIDWHIVRHGKIGGTTSKGLFVKSDTLLLDLVAEHTEPYDEDSEGFASDIMLRGLELEPEARQKLIEYTGHKYVDCGWIQSDIEILGISPDGITEDLKHAMETKCLTAKKHIEACLSHSILLEHIHQSIHYFTVNPVLETLNFLYYRPESIKPMKVFTLTRDSMVNIGTNAKPVMVTVRHAGEIARKEALLITDEIKKTIEKLKF